VYPDAFVNPPPLSTTPVPVNVYVAAKLFPPVATPGMVTLSELTASTSPLFIFNSKLEPKEYDPDDVRQTYGYATFPLPNPPKGSDGTSGTLVFKVPDNAEGDWGFAAAFLYWSNPSQFVVPAPTPNIAVSNTFHLFK
jgi:hypothetical protein